MSAPEEGVKYLPSDKVRDTLSACMSWVFDTGHMIAITVGGGDPDGALVPPATLAHAGLTPVSEQGVREARARWGALRSAAAEGPQGLTHHKTLRAGLVDQITAAALAHRLPVLSVDELELTGFAKADGEIIAPGNYALLRVRTLRIAEPYTVSNRNERPSRPGDST